MDVKKLIALIGATAAVIAAPSVSLAASGAKVSVRIEGAKKTLLAPTDVTTHSGSITKGGTPKGACPATSAAGALDVATHGKWGGKYDTSLGLAITQILGETHTFSSSMYWEIFVDNKPAQAGACGLKLHKGDQLLFAAQSVKQAEDLIAITAPATATVGKAFTIKVRWLNAKGAGKPLSGAKVSTGKKSATTKADGTLSVKASGAGTFVLKATHKGYIRSAPVTVTVSK